MNRNTRKDNGIKDAKGKISNRNGKHHQTPQKIQVRTT